MRLRTRGLRAGAAGLLPATTLLPLLIAELSLTWFLLGFSGQDLMYCDCWRREMEVPYSWQTAELEGGPIIQVTPAAVTLDGRPIAALSELTPVNAEDKLGTLYDELTTLRNNYVLLHPQADFEGSYALMVDRRLPFWVLDRIRRRAERAGFYNPQYVVEQNAWGNRD